jgi:dipeptidyl aminopeptidase/acylaminoacyl peptidase
MLRFVFPLVLMMSGQSIFSGSSHAGEPMKLEQLFQLERLADPQISPDGSRVVYQVTKIHNAAKNEKSTNLWLINRDGSGTRQLTYSSKSDSHPRWSPDGTMILFESTRDGSSQLYILDLVHGGEPRKITDISTGASQGLWSPDGSQIVFQSTVRPEFSILPFAESNVKNREYDEAVSANIVKARTFTKLFYRHWDSYVEDKRNHLFVIGSDGKDCRDITPGDRDAFPTSSTFVGGQEYTFSPDGSHVLFTAVPAQGEAWSTNHDICRVSIRNTSKQWPAVVSGIAAEGTLKFSPDGKHVAFRAQAKPGYEADKWQLMVQDCEPNGTLIGAARSLTADLDLSVSDYSWMGTSDLVFLSESNAAVVAHHASLSGPSRKIDKLFADGRSGQITGHSLSKDGFVLARATMNAPPELYSGTFALGTTKQITFHNQKLLESLDRPEPESVTVPVEGGFQMQMWILKPPGFDPNKKWPVVYLVHGGPQGAWEDGWSFRWNPQLWAAQGYVAVMPNPRGSTSFGQEFCDQIKIAKEFKCLVTHCSVYNFESMWGTTEELWFDEYEHGGMPWQYPEKYREFSPHRLAGNLGKYKTPMLVIHNDNDFRCPIGQGHELFQALQRQGVPSRFVNFPDEGHWVNKPANSLHWHKEIFSWLQQYCPAGGR